MFKINHVVSVYCITATTKLGWVVNLSAMLSAEEAW